MRIRYLAAIPALLIAGAAALPLAAPGLARSRGWSVADARWCGDGLCLSRLSKGETTVDRDKLLAAIKAAEASGNVVRDPTTRSYQTILPLLIKGRTTECLRVLDELAPRNPDPESVFYIARTYARLGAIEQGLTQFARSVDSGFCVPDTFARDPWLDSIRGQPRFIDALARAQVRHDQAARKFRDAGGERLLKLPA